MKQYLDFDPKTGVSHWVEVDEETGIASYGSEQDVSPILEANKAEYNADHGRWGEWTKVASVPMSVYLAWQQEGILGDSEEIKRRLNDPSLRDFRTRPGTL